ncbi:BURP domain-containing protein 12-like [Nymphaea colorata]|uniref:BURP domain-containing protein 12-like n=1 Tax=Nymphaea colorata TaxID=210225 RepID=UPI00129D233E|nr:BURP domain-containing protein 12-like [Nymphaea colorata]
MVMVAPGVEGGGPVSESEAGVSKGPYGAPRCSMTGQSSGALRASNAAGEGRKSVNPFSPKASFLRYWRNTELPAFLLAKCSPLNATQAATYARYIDAHTLQEHLPFFCASANFYCTFLKKKKRPNFVKYTKAGSSDFTNYSVSSNVAEVTFATYGGDQDGHCQQFTRYESDGNVGAGRFSKYNTEGIGQFNNYGDHSNVDQHRFTRYGDDTNAGLQMFTSYTENYNVVGNDFKSYGSVANGMSSQFSGYSTRSNVITNKFTSYNKEGNGPLDQFTSYAENGNIVRNQFQSYEAGGNAGLEQFQSYSELANLPDNSFRSYGKGDNGASLWFETYGNAWNPLVQFTEYGKDGNSITASFTFYSKDNTTFSDYHRTGTTFNDYRNTTVSNTALVEPGKFFREASLVCGHRIRMPDKLPPRSFLPRTIADKLPFCSRRLPELIRTQRIRVAAMIEINNLMLFSFSWPWSEHWPIASDRQAVKGETKRCVTSIEGMAEFGASVLGEKAWVSMTANTAGSGRMVEVGKVQGRSGSNEFLYFNEHCYWLGSNEFLY